VRALGNYLFLLMAISMINISVNRGESLNPTVMDRNGCHVDGL
jgi:hypothetical protein